MSPRGRPRLAGHAEAQRARILDAAQRRFIDQGFHAASMAKVAATAGMRTGLIYRYFESKNAIVLAIIERELAAARSRIAALGDAADLVQALLETFGELQQATARGFNAALFLEMSAEGTRAPQIADAIEKADKLFWDEFAAWLARPTGDGGLGIAIGEARVRARQLQLIVEGLAVRAARSRQTDAKELRQAIEPLVAAAMRPACG